MANYRQIHVQIWKDAWFLELSPEHKLLFIYLFSNERTSVAGIYDISLRVVAFETDLSREVIDEGLTLFAAADKIFYQDGVVWVKNLRKYNATNSIKVHERIRRDLEALKDCPLKDAYIAAEGMPIGTQNMPPAPPKRTGHPPGSRASATAVRLRLVSERGEACEQCGVASPVELHHIIPARAGGTLDDDNCILLCDECHQKADNENEERYPIPLTEIPYPAGVGEHVHVPSHAPVLAPVPALALGPAPSDKHPALMLYEQVTDRSVPNDTWRKRIQETVGLDPPALELWSTVLDGWIGHGWNPANVDGLLDCFQKGGIDERSERGNGSGKREPESKAARKRKYGRHAVTVLPDGKPP